MISRAEQLLSRHYCEHSERVNASLRERGLDVERSHEISSERDLIQLLEADIGIAVVPRHLPPIPPTLETRHKSRGSMRAAPCILYGVAGP